MDEQLVPKRAWSGSRDRLPLKTAAIESAQRKGDHQVGNLHVNCQHLVAFVSSYFIFLYLPRDVMQQLFRHI